MRKIIFIATAIIVLIYLYLIYNPIIVDKNNGDFQSSQSGIYFTEENGMIKPFGHLNFDESSGIEVILIIRDRENISDEIPFGRVFTTSNKNLINKLQMINFKDTGADIATVENEIIVYQHSKIIFRSAVLLETDKEGLQNTDFGWIETENGNLSRIFKKFNRNFSPIIKI